MEEFINFIVCLWSTGLIPFLLLLKTAAERFESLTIRLQAIRLLQIRPIQIRLHAHSSIYKLVPMPKIRPIQGIDRKSVV